MFQWEKWIKTAIISCVFLKCCTCEIVFCENVSYFLWCEMFFFFLKNMKMMVLTSSQTKPNHSQMIVFKSKQQNNNEIKHRVT